MVPNATRPTFSADRLSAYTGDFPVHVYNRSFLRSRHDTLWDFINIYKRVQSHFFRSRRRREHQSICVYRVQPFSNPLCEGYPEAPRPRRHRPKHMDPHYVGAGGRNQITPLNLNYEAGRSNWLGET